MEKLDPIEETNEYVAYDCDKVLYIKLKKGGVVSDHAHEHQEIVFLMEGELEVIINDQISNIKAPMKITIPSNAYHKFIALTDVIGLEIK